MQTEYFYITYQQNGETLSTVIGTMNPANWVRTQMERGYTMTLIYERAITKKEYKLFLKATGNAAARVSITVNQRSDLLLDLELRRKQQAAAAMEGDEVAARGEWAFAQAIEIVSAYL